MVLNFLYVEREKLSLNLVDISAFFGIGSGED